MIGFAVVIGCGAYRAPTSGINKSRYNYNKKEEVDWCRRGLIEQIGVIAFLTEQDQI